MTERKRILVTGALGHIGSALIRSPPDSLVGEITMLDNLESQRYCSLFSLPKNFTYRFVEADVRSVDLTELVNNVDAVIHLAALSKAEATLDKQKEVESVNLDG